MTGRPKNPNKPAATKAVRITIKTHQKLRKIHQGNEPYGNTVERALDQLEDLQKKVVALQLRIEGLHANVRQHDNANDELINILKKRDTEIDKLRTQRKTITKEIITQ